MALAPSSPISFSLVNKRVFVWDSNFKKNVKNEKEQKKKKIIIKSY